VRIIQNSEMRDDRRHGECKCLSLCSCVSLPTFKNPGDLTAVLQNLIVQVCLCGGSLCCEQFSACRVLSFPTQTECVDIVHRLTGLSLTRSARRLISVQNPFHPSNYTTSLIALSVSKQINIQVWGGMICLRSNRRHSYYKYIPRSD